MSLKPRMSFKRGQLWEAGFDGLYNTEDAVDAITGKVGQVLDDAAHRVSESKTQEIHREREREAFERAVLSRAEQFKNAFSRIDSDGDGKLSFEEFSQGLHSLGVILPEREVEAIWGQVFLDTIHWLGGAFLLGCSRISVHCQSRGLVPGRLILVLTCGSDDFWLSCRRYKGPMARYGTAS